MENLTSISKIPKCAFHSHCDLTFQKLFCGKIWKTTNLSIPFVDMTHLKLRLSENLKYAGMKQWFGARKKIIILFVFAMIVMYKIQ